MLWRKKVRFYFAMQPQKRRRRVQARALNSPSSAQYVNTYKYPFENKPSRDVKIYLFCLRNSDLTS